MRWQDNELNCLELGKQVFPKTPDGEKTTHILESEDFYNLSESYAENSLLDLSNLIMLLLMNFSLI